MNINNLKTQHEKIHHIMSETTELVKKNDLNMYARQIAKNISQLAGVIKIHLGSEDRSLYSALTASEDPKIQSLASRYSLEMGNLSDVYNIFKNKFNTESKINEHKEQFAREFKVVFTALKKRLDKEDNELYPLVEQL